MSKLLFIILLIFSFLFIVSFSFAAEPPPCECTSGSCCDGCNFRPSSYICDSSSEITCQTENQCEGAYGNNWTVSKCNASGDCVFDSSGWNYITNCPQEKACQGGSCVCSGNCLFQPTGPFPPDGDANVKLPVTLMWNAVNGAQSYRYKIDGVIEGVTTTPYIIIRNCTLHSSSTYSWQVQACCDTNGNNCGSWNDKWSFTTSLAPELLSPINNAVNVSTPVTLDWCDVINAQSYFLKIYKNGQSYYPSLVERSTTTGSLPSEAIFGPEVLTKNTTYDWMFATCLNATGTKCGVDCGNEQDGEQCGDYSPQWKFTTGELTLPLPKILSPTSTAGTPVVNFSNYLGWESLGKKGINSYRYEIKKGEELVLDNFTPATTTAVYFDSLWRYLEFNQVYSWKIRSCWDEEGNNCETEGNESTFKTTGAPPTLNEGGTGPVDNATNVIVPTKLNWDNMPGALSYYYEISTAPNFSLLVATNTTDYLKSEDSADYPKLKTETQYWWRVKTCADAQGRSCGEPTIITFITFELSTPSNPSPEDNGNLLTSGKYIGWEQVLGARFYQYKVDYGGAEKIPPTIFSTNSALLPIDKMELGNYTWYVKACLDENCQESGELAGPWKFNLIQGECEKSLVPCGRDCDAPGTPYNERDSCQFKHLFLLLKNILDFLLWRLGLIIIVLLAVATGVIYYFSMGAPTTMVKVKSLLKSAGIGYGIVFLAWIIINLILAVLGFKVDFFGHWWQISF